MIKVNKLQLEEPIYILSVNWPCRYFVIGILVSCILGGTSLLVIAYLNEQFKNEYWFFIVLLVFFTFVVISPGFWKPWAVFVADKKGVYLGNTSGSNPHFIPWDRIGHTRVGTCGRGNLGNGPCVFFHWKLVEEDRHFLRARFAFMVPNETRSGCIDFGIAANCHNPNKVQEQIEKIRTLCGYESALSSRSTGHS
jgi:hypothetical protein